MDAVVVGVLDANVIALCLAKIVRKNRSEEWHLPSTVAPVTRARPFVSMGQQ